MIWINLSKLPIKCDSNDIFYCKVEDEWIIPYIVESSVDLNRTIYKFNNPDIKVVPDEEFSIIENVDYIDIYDLRFDMPENLELYMRLKYT